MSKNVEQLRQEIERLKEKIDRLEPFVFKKTFTEMEKMFMKEEIDERVREEEEHMDYERMKYFKKLDERVEEKMKYLTLFVESLKGKNQRYLKKLIKGF